jgi:hypothetical protein
MPDWSGGGSFSNGNFGGGSTGGGSNNGAHNYGGGAGNSNNENSGGLCVSEAVLVNEGFIDVGSINTNWGCLGADDQIRHDNNKGSNGDGGGHYKLRANDALSAMADTASHYGYQEAGVIDWNNRAAMDPIAREYLALKGFTNDIEGSLNLLAASNLNYFGQPVQYAMRRDISLYKAQKVKAFIEQQKSIEAYNALPEIEKRKIAAQKAQDEVNKIQKAIGDEGNSLAHRMVKKLATNKLPEAKAAKEGSDKAVQEELERLEQEAKAKGLEEQKASYIEHIKDKFIQEKGMEILGELLTSKIEEEVVKALMIIPSPWGAIQIVGGIFILANKALDIKDLPIKVQNILNEYNTIMEESNNLNSNDPKIMQYLEDKKYLDQSFHSLESELHIPIEWSHHDEL